MEFVDDASRGATMAGKRGGRRLELLCHGTFWSPLPWHSESQPFKASRH